MAEIEPHVGLSEPGGEDLDPNGGGDGPVPRREEERSLVGDVLESGEVQRVTGLGRDTRIRGSQGAVAVPRERDRLRRLRRGLAVSGRIRADPGLRADCLDGPCIPGQKPTADRGGGPHRVGADHDAVRLGHATEVMRLEAGGFQRGDEELAPVAGPLDEVELFAGWTGQDGVMSEDVFAHGPVDVTGVPQALRCRELVAVRGVAVVLAPPRPGEPRHQLDREVGKGRRG
ncbi:hypothetical protein [Streptomyces sp. CC208A]|uniref:hypothetical protein n=1 Tax=Streptomyces sp. CC208A TaxID=3044573 RepID=UPI0024A8AAAC|nr:hypothetical protein [Streptomyces sp. CC208A]